jgi:hypothetical protein
MFTSYEFMDGLIHLLLLVISAGAFESGLPLLATPGKNSQMLEDDSTSLMPWTASNDTRHLISSTAGSVGQFGQAPLF